MKIFLVGLLALTSAPALAETYLCNDYYRQFAIEQLSRRNLLPADDPNTLNRLRELIIGLPDGCVKDAYLTIYKNAFNYYRETAQEDQISKEVDSQTSAALKEKR